MPLLYIGLKVINISRLCKLKIALKLLIHPSKNKNINN